MSIRVVEYQPPQPVAKPGGDHRQALAQAARDSLALGRSVGQRLQARDYAGAVEDSIGSTVAAVEGMPRPEQSPALLGALEAHITQTELPPPAGTEQPWQRQAATSPPGVAGIGPNGPNADFWDDAGAAPEGQDVAPGAWSYYQDIDDSGAYSATAEYFGTFTAGFGDDTREASDLARSAISRIGDPEAQAAHAEREALHLAGQERPELIEQARRAMGLAVPSARPGKSRGNYPEAAADPAGSNYGTGMEGIVGKGMVAYSGNTKATPQEIADDFQVSARTGKPLDVFRLRPEADAQAGQVNARLMEAAKKSPVVALGADPRNTVYTKEAARDAVGGAYGRTLGGKMQVNANSPATAAHESIHNGLDRLLKDPKLPARFKAQLGNHEQQEFITRMFMIKTYGETESEGEQALGFKGNHPQIIRAREMLADPKWQAWTADLEAYAARKIARDRPGGPR